MVGPVGGSLPVVPVREVPRAPAAPRAVVAVPRRRSDWIDISNLSAIDSAAAPGGPFPGQARAGLGVLGEVSGFLGELKALIAPDHPDARPEAARSRQVKADAILAGIDRLSGMTKSEGAALPGGMAASTGSDGLTLPATDIRRLGEISDGAKRLSLADIRSGGAAALDSPTAMRIVNAAIQTISDSRLRLERSASQTTNGTAPSAADLEAIRAAMLAGGSAAMREPNRAAAVHLLG